MPVPQELATMFPGISDMIYNVGGGQIQADQALQAQDLAQRMELSRLGLAQSLMGQLADMQRDPFSIVPALQAYGAAGGGTLSPIVALANSGGQGMPSPYGSMFDNILKQLGDVAGGNPLNPNTGRPYTPDEAAYLRQLSMNQQQSQGQAGSDKLLAMPKRSAKKDAKKTTRTMKTLQPVIGGPGLGYSNIGNNIGIPYANR